MKEVVGDPARARQERIATMVRERDFVRVRELAGSLEVSEVTVRSDLDALAARGLVRRLRGAAVARRPTSLEDTFSSVEAAASLGKRAIARAAAQMVCTGDTIVLDGGTTTTAIASALAERRDLDDVTVLTSSLAVALALEPAALRLTVVVTGGTLRPTGHSLVEPLAGLVLDTVHAGTAVIGCDGVDVAAGVTNVNLPETDVKRRMIAASQRVVVCADASKLGRVALAHVCHLDQVALVLTDAAADPAEVEALREAGVQVTLAEPLEAPESPP